MIHQRDAHREHCLWWRPALRSIRWGRMGLNIWVLPLSGMKIVKPYIGCWALCASYSTVNSCSCTCACVCCYSYVIRIHLRILQYKLFFFFFLYAAVGNDNLAVFQCPAYLHDCTSYLCGTKLAERRGVLPGILTTSYISRTCNIENFFFPSMLFKKADLCNLKIGTPCQR